VLTGRSVFAVDLQGDAGAWPRALAGAGADADRVRMHLKQLPCPTVAVVDRGAAQDVLDDVADFDVAAEPAVELAPVLDTVARRPIASMALVQLLRLNARLEFHEGLIAESLVYSTLQGGPEFTKWMAGRKLRSPGKANPEPAVLVTRKGACMELVLNRPERHNAFSIEIRDGLSEALRAVTADATVEEIVIRARGPSFSAGGDLEEFGTHVDAATSHAVRSTRSVGRLLSEVAERVSFRVHGACVGAGMELPAFGGRVIARRDSYFQLPEVGMGLVPGAGGTVSIPRRIGRQRTAYLALAGVRIDAARAKAWGLVDEIAD
jgi:enoyl-CoA hydratase